MNGDIVVFAKLVSTGSKDIGIIVLEAIGGLTVDNERVYTTYIVLTEEMFEFVGLTLVWFGFLYEIES